MTPILGETKDGLKTTQKSSKILPEVVIYDVNLTLTLPRSLSATSGFNAIAHLCVPKTRSGRTGCEARREWDVISGCRRAEWDDEPAHLWQATYGSGSHYNIEHRSAAPAADALRRR